CGLAYWIMGMPPFDALVHAFSTLATGGFSSHDASIGHFDNPALEWVVMLFMLLGTINFATHFAVWRSRSLRTYWADSEFRMCLAIVLVFSVLASVPLILALTYADAGTSIRKGMFHV